MHNSTFFRGVPSPPALGARLRQINPAEQQCQLLRLYLHGLGSVLALRPREAPALQSLCANPHAAAIPEEHFQPRPVWIAEQKYVPGKRIPIELLTNQPA